MKRIMAALLCGFMLMSMTACSGGDPAETTVDPESTAETTVDPSKPLELKVGFIYNDTVANSTVSPVFELARKEIATALGVETCYMENVLVSDFTQAVDKMEQAGCNVIVSGSHKFINSVKKLSRTNTDTKFICFGGNATLSNMTTFDPKLYQPAHICGTVAAYNSTANLLGIVADPNMYNVCAIIDAYILGAKTILGTETDVRLNTANSTSESETKTAIDNLVSQGCDVIMLYQSSTYGIKYCESIGVKVVTFACNAPDLAPNSYLTGFYYNINTYLVDVVSKIMYRSFTAELFQEGLKSGAVRMSSLAAGVKDGTKDITSALYKLIEADTTNIFSGELKDNTNTIQVQKGSYLSHTLINAIDWIEKSVTVINDYTNPILEDNLVSSDFEIKYTDFGTGTTAPEVTADPQSTTDQPTATTVGTTVPQSETSPDTAGTSADTTSATVSEATASVTVNALESDTTAA